MHDIESGSAAGRDDRRIGKRERRRQRMLAALHGRCCIYKERGFLALVRVVSVENKGDDYFFCLEVVKRLTTPSPDRFVVGVAGEYLRISQNWTLQASWVNWHLVTRTDLVSLVMESFGRVMPSIDLVRLVSRIG
jgi:hypothetical protein